MKLKLKNNFIFLLFFSLVLYGCYEPKEGCLDVRATNFDLDADNPCPDCCEYPVFKLKTSHRYIVDDTTYYTVRFGDSIYLDGANHPFRLESVRYFLSGFELIKSSGEAVSIEDKIDIEVSDGSGSRMVRSFTDDFVLINAAHSSTITVGTFTQPGTYKGIRFLIGLDPVVDTAIPQYMPENHPLSNTADEMYDAVNGHYYASKIALFKDTVPSDTIPRIIASYASNASQLVDLPFSEEFTLPEGFHLHVTLAVDCISWFDGVDVRSDSDAVVIEKINAALPTSFFVSSISTK